MPRFFAPFFSTSEIVKHATKQSLSETRIAKARVLPKLALTLKRVFQLTFS